MEDQIRQSETDRLNQRHNMVILTLGSFTQIFSQICQPNSSIKNLTPTELKKWLPPLKKRTLLYIIIICHVFSYIQ